MRINFGTSRKPAQQENSKIPNFAYSFQDETDKQLSENGIIYIEDDDIYDDSKKFTSAKKEILKCSEQKNLKKIF